MPGLLWFAGAVLMMAEFGDAARAATPDLLCSVLFLGGLFAYVRGREVAAAILLFLAFMARPDSIVFLAIFAVLLVGYRQKAWGALAGFAASLVAYFASSHWAQHPGLVAASVVLQRRAAPQYGRLRSAVLGCRLSPGFCRLPGPRRQPEQLGGHFGAGAGGWYAASRAGFKLDRRAGILFAALVFGVLAKFTVFPIRDTRIYFPNLIPPYLLLAGPFMALWASIKGRRPAVLHFVPGDKP